MENHRIIISILGIVVLVGIIITAFPIFFVIFRAPGKLIMYLQYYFPENISGAMGSSRRRGKVQFEIIFSLMFWCVILYISFYIIIVLLESKTISFPEHKSAMQSYTEKPEKKPQNLLKILNN